MQLRLHPLGVAECPSYDSDQRTIQIWLILLLTFYSCIQKAIKEYPEPFDYPFLPVY